LKDNIIFPSIFKPYTNLVAGQSTRLGGVSIKPYDSLNLGSNTSDNAAAIEKNKVLFTEQLGFTPQQVVRSKQIHGTEILNAENAGYFNGYDAIVTKTKGLLLAVSTADCTPILLYDPKSETIAAIHAGWKGTKDYLVSKTLIKMKEAYGSKYQDVIAYIGPCIAECSFEVDADVAQYFDGRCSRFDSTKGKYFVDLKKHNKNQLLHLGVMEENIEVSHYDTFERTDLFFSHRKENGITGRMWTAIGLTSQENITKGKEI
jgi:polyphenol oxidase